jgi:putative transcriptional regulator
VQRGDDARPAQGKLLVARRELPDPNFSETVVLLIEHDERGTVGVVVNRPTEVSLATLIPGLEHAGARQSRVYRGGPVGEGSMMVLLRASDPPPSAQRVFADVWVSRSRETLERLEERTDTASSLRVYDGYAGWAPGQLEAEIARNDWYVLDADPGFVFHPNPRGLWHRLLPPDPDSVAWALPNLGSAPTNTTPVRR